jgi:ABC-type sugar transport system ATPase subunit
MAQGRGETMSKTLEEIFKPNPLYEEFTKYMEQVKLQLNTFTSVGNDQPISERQVLYALHELVKYYQWGIVLDEYCDDLPAEAVDRMFDIVQYYGLYRM